MNFLSTIGILCFSFYSNAALCSAPPYGDTAYVCVDSATIDTLENSFDLVLMCNSESGSYEVYRVKNQDYCIEFEFSFSFSNKDKSYSSYTVFDLPTGVEWSIIFDKKSKAFYRTDTYNLQAIGDEIVKGSVDFQKYRVLVKSGIGDRLYSVKLIKLEG